MKPVNIIGSGPAGLTAAINLAIAGFKVNVFEKQSEVGKRFHGDLQGLENWSENGDILSKLKDMNIKTNFDYDPFSTLTVLNGMKKVDIRAQKPLFYLIKRGSMIGSLDQGLKQQAIKRGVQIHFGKTIDQQKAQVMASGPSTNKIFAIAKGIVFRTKMQDIAVGLLNDFAAYKGYAYLLVTKNHGCMCSILFGHLDSAQSCFEETKRIFLNHYNVDIQNPKYFGGYGNFSTRNIFKRDNTLFVGEAAGIQDMLWGFGIRNAITSGFLAAQSIIENKDYEKAAKNYFCPRLKASLVNRFTWELFRIRNYSFILHRLKSTEDIINLLYSMHQFTFLHKLIYPFAWLYMKNRYSKLRI